MKRRIFAWMLSFLLAALCVLPAAATEPLAVMGETTILFTHDLHSHFLPQPAEGGGGSGGYARLKGTPSRCTAAGWRRFLHRVPDPDPVHHAGR